MTAPDPADSAPTDTSYVLSGDFRGAVVNVASTFVSAATVQDIEGLPPEPGEPPYKGLYHFDEADADHFLGRENLTARLAGRLRETRFLAVIGASGSGKSSVVRAGLVPALRRGKPLADGALPPAGSDRWLVRVMTPTAHPLDALAAALLPDAEPATVVELRDRLAAAPATLAEVAPGLLGADHPRLLLVVDQFEEVFSLARHEAERRAFIDNLAAAATGAAPATVVIVLRADFYARCAQYDGLRELVSQQQEYIGAMTREELFRVIVLPAARADWKIQEGLVELMLDDVGDEPGALPLLSHALLETWQRRRARTMTLSGYRESGGVRGAIAKTAETVFRRRLTDEQRPIARMIFVRLTELGESADGETPDTRRRAQFSELITRSTDAPTLEAVLGILIDARLITTDVVPPGETKVIEVCHEALIREWPTLRDWLNRDRERLIRHRQLTADVNDWLSLDRDPGALYRGAKLDQALAWTADPPDPLSMTELEFLDAGRAAAAEEARRAERLARAARNQRILAGVSVVLLVGVILVALYALGVFDPPAEPEQMGGDFGIAVAEFVTLNAAGAPVGDSPGGARLADRVASGLAAELGDDPAFQIWVDSPELLEQHHVTIGPAAESIAGIETPAAMAARLGAETIVYGQVVPNESGINILGMSFYPAPRLGQDLTRVVGRHEFSQDIPVFDPADPGAEVWRQLDPQAQALARILRGLHLTVIGDDAGALAAFERAGELAPDSDLAHYFVGQENLYLAQAGGAIEPEALAAAAAAFERSLRANPDNARSQIGAGSVHFLRAQGILDETKRDDFTGDRAAGYEAAAAEARLALAAHEPVAAGDEQIERYGVPIASMANYEAGIALRVLAEALYRGGRADEAATAIDEAIVRLESAVGPLVATDNSRMAAQAHQALGTVYEWRGFLLDQNGDPTTAAEAYRRAVAAYQACAAVGEQYPFDTYMIDEIVEPLCLPRIVALDQVAGE